MIITQAIQNPCTNLCSIVQLHHLHPVGTLTTTVVSSLLHQPPPDLILAKPHVASPDGSRQVRFDSSPFYNVGQGTDPTPFIFLFIARRVQLTGGNLVLDCPVPNKYLDAVPNRDAHEFTHMRYTAATCDPSEFVSQGYTLRQHLLGRQTELFIVMVRKEKGCYCDENSVLVY